MVRLWTSGAPVDYNVTAYKNSLPLEEKPSWHVVISLVAHTDVGPGNDDFQCLPLTSMFDLTAPGKYTIIAARRFRDGNSDGTVTGPSVQANELQLTVTPPARTASASPMRSLAPLAGRNVNLILAAPPRASVSGR